MSRHRGINYIKQRKAGYCVAISIINALKWAGAKRVTEKNLEFIYKEAGKPGGKDGTKKKKVDKALKKCKKYFSSKYVKHPPLRSLFNWLTRGNAIILDYYVEDHHDLEIGHSVLVFLDNNRRTNKVVVVNNSAKGISFLKKTEFKKLLKKTDYYHTAYLIRKVND